MTVRRQFIVSAAILLLCGCTVGPDFARPALPSGSAGYALDDTARVALASGPAQRWWTAFGSGELNALVDRAMAGNQTLDASRATLDRAREQASAVAGRQLPQAEINARGEYQQFNLSAVGLGDQFGSAGIGNPEFDLYTVGGGVSYDLDLFGRNRRAFEQAAAQSEAQLRETEAAHLVIAGKVVNQVLTIAALNDRIAAERALVAESERNVALTEARRRGGFGTMVEVVSAQGQLAADRTSLPALNQQQAEARAALAVLLGISPRELEATPFSLDQFAVPDPVPVALPSALVRQRPDILQAEARLHAATAAVGIATADLYPDVTLGASTTQSTSTPGQILNSKFNAFDLFAGLTAPVFDGGTRKANRRAAEADARAAAATYRQTVLEAFGQVSGLLAAIGNDAAALTAQDEAVHLADRSLYLSRRSFQVGNSGILQVLDASRTHKRSRIGLIDAKARQLVNISRLYVATAGGWVEVQPTREKQAGQ